MRRREHAAQRRGEAVHRPESGVGQGEPAQQTGPRHIGARFQVLRVFPGARQCPRGAAHAIHAKQVRHAVGARRNVRFNELRERVQTGGCRNRRRQAERQFGIHDRQARQHPERAQTGLHLVFGRAKHGVARDLASGAGRSGHGDHRRRRLCQGLPAADDLQVIQRVSGVGQQRGHSLSGVQHAAAPDGDHHIAALLAGTGNTLADRRHGRLTGDGDGYGRQAGGRVVVRRR